MDLEKMKSIFAEHTARAVAEIEAAKARGDDEAVERLVTYVHCDREVELFLTGIKTPNRSTIGAWTPVELHRSYNNPVKGWLNRNTHRRWAVDGGSGWIGSTLYFEDENDAFAFRMRWGGTQ
jgi:hypothetical protein